LHSEDFYNLNSSAGIITWMIKSRGMRWERQVACMGKMTNAYKMLVGKSEGKNHLTDIQADKIKMYT